MGDVLRIVVSRALWSIRVNIMMSISPRATNETIMPSSALGTEISFKAIIPHRIERWCSVSSARATVADIDPGRTSDLLLSTEMHRLIPHRLL